MERFTNAAFSFEVTDTPAACGDGPGRKDQHCGPSGLDPVAPTP